MARPSDPIRLSTWDLVRLLVPWVVLVVFLLALAVQNLATSRMLRQAREEGRASRAAMIREQAEIKRLIGEVKLAVEQRR